MATKEKWDGRSRPSNKAYDEGYARIFNPVAAAVRTPKFRSKVIKNRDVTIRMISRRRARPSPP